MGRKHFHLKPLSPQESDALKSFMHQTAIKRRMRIRRRGSAVLNSTQGWTIQQISQNWSVSERTVRNWLHRFQQRGVKGLYDDRVHRGRLTRPQVDQVFQLKHSIVKSKRTGKLNIQQNKMSYRKIAEWIKSKWDISLSHVRVRQIIKNRLRDGGDFSDLVPITRN